MLSLINAMMGPSNASAAASAAAALALPANDQTRPEQIPSLEERAAAVATIYRVPSGVAALISKYAMERFDDDMFGLLQWKFGWGVTPVTLTKTFVELQDLVNQKVISGEKTEKPVEQMNEVECANFLRKQGIEVCKEEHVEPTEELYECLNRRVRPQDKLLAGFTCVVTYIPQFVTEDENHTILAVTARTLALNIPPATENLEPEETRFLFDRDYAFNSVLTPEDADRSEASCYFVMERDVAPDTRRKAPSILIKEITSQGDKGWQLPEPRNFFATVFSRYVWRGEFLYGENPPTETCVREKGRDGYIMKFGLYAVRGLGVNEHHSDCGSNKLGASGSRKFPPKLIKSG